MYVKLRMLLLLILGQFLLIIWHICAVVRQVNAVIMASTCAFFYIPGILP